MHFIIGSIINRGNDNLIDDNLGGGGDYGGCGSDGDVEERGKVR